MHDAIQPYTHQDFPRWVYGIDASSRLVQTQEELDALDGDWFDSPAEASEEAPKEADDLAAARKDAEAAGVKFDARWGVKRIRTEIEKAGTK